MADEVLISQIVDRNGIGADRDFLIKSANEIYQAYLKLQSSLKTISGPNISSTELRRTLEEINEAQKKLDASTRALINAKKQSSDEDLRAQKLSTESARTAREEAKARDLNAAAALKEAKAVELKNKATNAKTDSQSASVEGTLSIDTGKSQDAFRALTKEVRDTELALKNEILTFGVQSAEAEATASKLSVLRDRLREVNEAASQKNAPVNLSTGSGNTAAEIQAKQAKEQEQANLELAKSEEFLAEKEAELDASRQSAVASGNQRAKLVKEESAANAQSSVAVEETALAFDEYTGSLRQNIALQIENEQALSANKAAQKEVEQAIKASGGASDAQIGKLAALREEYVILNEQNKSLGTTVRNQAREFAAGAGGVDELQAQLNLLQQTYSQLSEAEQNTPFGKAIATEIDVLLPKVNAAENRMGIFSRNVGNYFQSLSPLFQNLSNEISKLKAEQKGLVDLQARNPVGFQLAGGNEKLNQVTASIQQLEQAEQVASKTVGSYTGQINNLRTAAQQVGFVLGNDSDLVKQFGVEINKGEQELKEFNDALKIAAGGPKIGSAFVGAFKVLEDELANVRKQLADPNLKGAALDELRRREAALVSATALVGKEFVTATAEARAFQQAAVQVGTGYDQKTTVFKNFTAEVKNGTKAVQATNDAVKQTVEGGKGIAGVFSKGFGIVRQLAYVLPGIGIAGIFSLAFEALSKLFGGFDLFKEKVVKIKTEVQALGEAFAGSEYTEAVKNVQSLTINIDLAKKGLLDKTDVLEQYNNSIGKTTGQVTSLDEAEKALVKNGEAYIQMTLYKAAANIALGKAAQKAFEIQQNELNTTTGDANYQQGINTARTAAEAAFRQTETYAKKYKELDDKRIKEKKGFAEMNAALDTYVTEQVGVAVNANAIKEKDELNQVAKDLQTKAAEIGKKFKFDVFGDADKDAKTKNVSFDAAIKARYDALQRDAKARYDLLRQSLQDEVDLQKAFAEGKGSVILRVEARQKEADKEKEIVELETQFELHQNDLKIESIRKVAEYKSSKAKTSTERSQIMQAAQIEIDAATLTATEIEKINDTKARKITDIENRLFVDTLRIRQQDAADAKSAVEKEITEYQRLQDAKVKAAVDVETKTLENNEGDTQRRADKRLTILNNEYAAGKIAKEKYEREKRDIENKALAESLENQISFYTNLVELYDFDEEAKRKALNKIIALQKQLSGLKVTFKTEGTKDALDDLKKIEEAVTSYADILNTLSQGLGNAGSQTRLNQIAEEQEALETRYQREKELIEQTIINQTEKQQKLQELDAKHAAYQKTLADKERAEKQRQAEAEKRGTLFKILINTARAVVEALPDVAKSVRAGIVGAAEFAVAAAAPVPRYKHGKNSSDTYAGPAIVGDGGKRELVVRKNGRLELTPDVPTLTYVDREDIIFPDAQKELAKMPREKTDIAFFHTYQKADDNTGRLIANGLNKMEKNVVRAIENIPQTNVLTENPVKQWVQKGGNLSQYLNRYR